MVQTESRPIIETQFYTLSKGQYFIQQLIKRFKSSWWVIIGIYIMCFFLLSKDLIEPKHKLMIVLGFAYPFILVLLVFIKIYFVKAPAVFVPEQLQFFRDRLVVNTKQGFDDDMDIVYLQNITEVFGIVIIKIEAQAPLYVPRSAFKTGDIEKLKGLITKRMV